MTAPPVAPFRRGDFVFVTYATITLPGFVALASPCARSLVVMFNGRLGDHFVGSIPVLWSDARGDYVDLFYYQPIVITPMHDEADA